MAYIQSAAILTAIREVLEDGAGSLRTISARFAGQLPAGAREDTELAKALVKPRVEASIVGIGIAKETPPITGNFRVYDLEVEVRCVRIIRPIEQVDDDTRVATQALAADDADVIAQALGYPGNLTQTAAAAATDLVSGCLIYTRSRARVARRIDEGAQPLETIHSFRGKAIARPATS